MAKTWAERTFEGELHICRKCHGRIATLADKDTKSIADQHVACPAKPDTSWDKGQISRSEGQAIRDYTLGHVTPDPYMVDGGGPDSLD